MRTLETFVDGRFIAWLTGLVGIKLRALAFGRNTEADDHVADAELGEELGHAVMLDLALDLDHLVAGKFRQAEAHAIAGFI